MDEIKEEIKHGKIEVPEENEVETSGRGKKITGSGLEAIIGEIREGEETINSNLEAAMDEIEELEEKSISLEEKLSKKTAQYEDVYNKYQRLWADFENQKKRIDREKSEIFLYANEKIGLDLLNIIDSLEGALQSQNKPGNSDEFDCLLDGINLVYKQLIDVLARHGITEIEAFGKPFDMNFHHAVAQEETECEPGHVIGVLQKGYKIYEKVLRPAMVIVSK